jgi:hypothetical protein
VPHLRGFAVVDGCLRQFFLPLLAQQRRLVRRLVSSSTGLPPFLNLTLLPRLLPLLLLLPQPLLLLLLLVLLLLLLVLLLLVPPPFLLMLLMLL